MYVADLRRDWGIAMEPQAQTISMEELERLKKLTAEIAEFRKSLEPSFAAIEKEVSSLACFEKIKQIMQFEGKKKLTVNVKVDSIPYEVTFKVKQTA